MLSKSLIILFCYICSSRGSITVPSTSDVDTRITRGQDAAEGPAHYHASLRNMFNAHFCGGTILNNKWVLTAAQCTINQSKNIMKVVVGTNSRSSGGDKYSVDKIINHEKFNSKTRKNDVSLIKVTPVMKFNEYVYPVQLPDSNIEGGVDVLMNGWGKLSNNGKLPEKMHTIKLTTLSVKECHQMSGKSGNISDTQLCTMPKQGEGACVGDVGGPLIQDMYVVGVVSFGGGCGKSSPDVFTRVFSFNKWIEERTGVFRPLPSIFADTMRLQKPS